MKTKEEMLKISDRTHSDINKSINEFHTEDVLEAMEEYASQFKKPVLTGIEISDKAFEASRNRIINLQTKFFIEGFEKGYKQRQDEENSI